MPRAVPKRSTLHASRSTIFVIVVGFTLSLLLWMQAAVIVPPWEPQPLRVWMLDVGQGDAFFIRFPTGERWLIDGGPDDAVLAKLGSVIPPWDRRLDAVLLTHPDADHVTGLVSVLDRYDVGTVYETGVRAHTPYDEAFTARLNTTMTGRTLLRAGDVLRIGDVTLTIVWPDDPPVGMYPDKRNNFSINLVLEYGDTSILFTGDAETVVEEAVGPRARDVDVLKVGHHGSLTSSSIGFLAHTRPEIALISAGRDNAYGHPHPVVLRRFEDVGAAVYRTDQQRDVLLTSDGGEPSALSQPLPF